MPGQLAGKSSHGNQTAAAELSQARSNTQKWKHFSRQAGRRYGSCSWSPRIYISAKDPKPWGGSCSAFHSVFPLGHTYHSLILPKASHIIVIKIPNFAIISMAPFLTLFWHFLTLPNLQILMEINLVQHIIETTNLTAPFFETRHAIEASNYSQSVALQIMPPFSSLALPRPTLFTTLEL